MTTEYAITSQDVRNCGATQQIRYDCLFRNGIVSEETFYDVEAKARAKNIGVGVENFLYRKGEFYQRRSSFVIMILLAEASHIEKMMVQVQCGQDSHLPPVRVFLVCLSMKVHLTSGFLLAGIPENIFERCGT